MLFNNDLKKLFELLDLKEEDIFKGGEGVYKQQQAEEFMESVYQKGYDDSGSDAAIEYEQKQQDEYDEAYDDGQADICRYLNSFIDDELKSQMNENYDETTFEKVVELIKTELIH